MASSLVEPESPANPCTSVLVGFVAVAVLFELLAFSALVWAV